MQVEMNVVKKLGLSEAAEKVTSSALDRLPVLISERCLSGHEGSLVKEVVTRYVSGTEPTAATFSMPRKGFGPRPVTFLAARDRVAYDALVNKLRSQLPTESRTPDNWAAFRTFGRGEAETAAKYIVTIDIASMYEYVDHAILRRELLVQTTDVHHVEATISLLTAAFGAPRGLPQMMSSSDVLADAYLSILERALLRHGYRVARYADDFRIQAQDWSTANQVIERAAEVARSLGLILSSEKTSIHKAEKLADEEVALQQTLDKYFTAAQAELTTFEELLDWYGDPVSTEREPDEQDAMAQAFRKVLHDWRRKGRKSKIPSQLVAKALRSLRTDGERISDKTLTQLVFQDPLKLSSVILYLSARAGEAPQNIRSLRRLVDMERQSPWAKLWMLDYCSTLERDDSDKHSRALMTWVLRQLKDEHEVVRAQAAWAASVWGSLNERRLAKLFGAATSISRAGLSAAWGRAGSHEENELSKTIIGSSPVCRDSFAWGVEQREQASQSAG